MSKSCWKCHEPKAPTIPHSDSDCIQVLRSRIEAIESKLEAVCQRESATREDAGATTGVAKLSQAAAPNLTAKYWRSTSEEAQKVYLYHYARACDLAAAVTECYDRGSGSIFMPSFSLAELLNSCLAFVRGEPLPQKGG